MYCTGAEQSTEFMHDIFGSDSDEMVHLLFIVLLKPHLNSYESSPVLSEIKSCEKSQMRIPVAGGSALK